MRVTQMPKEVIMTEYIDTTSPRFQKGLKIRREVLGSEHVDRSLQSADDFTGEFQQIVTEWCWGDLWGRPGLDRRTRSIINLAMLAALNRPHEVRLHVRGALNNGLTKEEIKEVLLQVMVYCGVPAALDAMKVAADVFREEREAGRKI
jgi:4-carboxymuconolactone decarboxylase